ncbi:MAG: hypothetical protein KGH65_02950 [Candidatus Micrarchaeota archaeon]|nr:hypothetical protein [Candidatus Micrarchaeota archaeon]
MKNRKILKKVLTPKYLETLSFLLSVFQKSRHPKICTGVLIGSQVHSPKRKSDLDLCFYTNQINNSKELINSIKKIIDRPQIKCIEAPRYISDYHNRRIELNLQISGILIEIAILDWDLNFELTPHLIRKDEFERHIGNLFIYGICFYDLPRSNYHKIKEKFTPYYDESLRILRIRVLKLALTEKIKYLANFSPDKLAQLNLLYVIERMMLQYAFIYYKVYPYSYEKWIKKQFLELIKSKKLYFKFVDSFYGDYTIKQRVSKINSLLNYVEKGD